MVRIGSLSVLIVLVLLLMLPRLEREQCIEITPELIDLGVVTAGKPVSFNIDIRNCGSSVAYIHGVKTSCDCTHSSERTFEVRPNEEHSLVLTVLTQPKSGQITGDVVIYYGDRLQSQTIKYRGLSLIDSEVGSELNSDTRVR